MKTSAKSRKRARQNAAPPVLKGLPLKLIGAWLDSCGSPKRKTAQLLSSLSTMDRRQVDQRYTVSSALTEDDTLKLPIYRLEVLVMSDTSINLTLFEQLPFELGTAAYMCALSTKEMDVSAGNSRTPAAGLMAYAGSTEDDGDEEDFDEDLGEPIEVSPKRPTATRQRRQRRARAVSATK